MTLVPLTLVWLGRFEEAEDAIARASRETREVGYSLHDGFVLVRRWIGSRLGPFRLLLPGRRTLTLASVRLLRLRAALLPRADL